MSSMPVPRMRLAEFSPITQRRASTRFDLPQPFGPTIPVRPGWITKSVGSTKDLKPDKRNLVNCTGTPFQKRDTGENLLRQCIKLLAQLFQRRHTAFGLAVDNQG